MLIHSPMIPTDGLVLCLDAANSRSYTSGSTWYDLSKIGTNGTLIDSPSFTTDGGGGISFSTDDYVDLGYKNFQTTSPFSIISVLHADTTPHAIMIDSNNAIYFVALNSSTVIRWRSAGGIYDYTANRTLTGNQIIAITCDGSENVTIYQDGIALDTKVILVARSINRNAIGPYVYGNTGIVHAFLEYDRELTPGEIYNIYTAYRGRLGI